MPGGPRSARARRARRRRGRGEAWPQTPAAPFDTASRPSSRPLPSSPAMFSNVTPCAVEAHRAAEILRHQPGRERRALRLEADLAGEAERPPGNRIDRPAGAACGVRRADRGRDHRRRIEILRLDRSIEPRHILEPQRRAALRLVAADRAGELIEIERRRLAGGEPQRALAGGVNRAGGELAFDRELAAERPARRHVEPRRLAVVGDDAIETDDSQQRSRRVGLQIAVDTDRRAAQRAGDRSA